MKRSAAILVAWAMAIGLISTAFQQPGPTPTAPQSDPDEGMTRKNLKIIPKSTSKEDMEVLMTRMGREVGVGCHYCHINTRTNPPRADFASDANPIKEKTRQMMRMTDEINKKYFQFDNRYEIMRRPPVSCRTCHRGLINPSLFKLYNRRAS